MDGPPSHLRETIERLLQDGGHPSTAASWHALGDGVGGARWRIAGGDGSWFVKTGNEPDLFFAEADGLVALRECGAVRVPRVRHAEAGDEGGFIVLEWLDIQRATSAGEARLGEQLARLHACHGRRFGWRRHNFIGATPQFNTLMDDWPAFLREHRLGFQLRLAAENGHRGMLQKKGALLLEKLAGCFSGYRPAPSLLHGDLWGGNHGFLASGEPVIFDPAVYYGDREADVAMTELFGGFGGEFHAAYRAAAPLDPGYGVRRHLYNLYHVLNHLNLFGEGYLGQAQGLLDRLLAELG